MRESGRAWDWVGRLHLPTVAVLAAVVVAWTLLSRRYGAYVLPAPWSIVTGFLEIVRTGEIWKHTGASLYRIVVGFGLAVLVSLAMGLAAFVSTSVRGVVHDVLAILNSTSVFVWIVISLI